MHITAMTSAYAILEPRRNPDPSRRLPSAEPLSWEHLYGEPSKNFDDDEEDEFGFGNYDYDDDEEEEDDEEVDEDAERIDREDSDDFDRKPEDED
ncbi:MAG: hypothetical protein JWO89_3415 [Verrucomicrobiaceae bacterium]|nr:hypothetical protein [Verrucomicrobiaceae bacterium]